MKVRLGGQRSSLKVSTGCFFNGVCIISLFLRLFLKVFEKHKGVREVQANGDSYKAIINILPVPTLSTIKGQFNLGITSPQAVEDRTFCIANAPTTCASMCANVVSKPFFVALETSMRNRELS